eukprot:1281375-Prorocentrum_lima.AAC.1
MALSNQSAKLSHALIAPPCQRGEYDRDTSVWPVAHQPWSVVAVLFRFLLVDGCRMGKQHRVSPPMVVGMCHRHIQISVGACTAVDQFDISFHLMECTVSSTSWLQFGDYWFRKRQ